MSKVGKEREESQENDHKSRLERMDGYCLNNREMGEINWIKVTLSQVGIGCISDDSYDDSPNDDDAPKPPNDMPDQSKEGDNWPPYEAVEERAQARYARGVFM